MLLCMRVMAPYAVEAWVNKRGPDNLGYSFRINDIDFKVLKGEMILEDVEVFDTLTKTDFAEASRVKVEFHFLDHFKGGDLLEVTADHINLILTNEILNQFKKLSAKAEGDYTARIKEFVIKQMYNSKTQKLFTLHHSVMDVSNGSFRFHSKISEGGSVELRGEKNVIEGELTGISSAIVERFSEDKLPVEINDQILDAKISASSGKNGIEGTIHPVTNNFSLVKELKPPPIPWWIKKKEFDPLVIEIPFTLKENISLDFAPTVEELRRRNL